LLCCLGILEGLLSHGVISPALLAKLSDWNVHSAATAALALHPLSRHPARTAFATDFSPSQFLDDVAHPDPQHADGNGRVTRRPIVDGDLDFVGLIDVNFKVFVPSVGRSSGRMSSRSRGILDFYDDD
jgi:hypothetical protein